MARKRKCPQAAELSRKLSKLDTTTVLQDSRTNGDSHLPYPPLDSNPDSFRLLKLLPGQSSGAVQCELFVASIQEQKNRYTALSYTWGTAKSSINIVVNGRRFSVRKNLYTFFESCVTRKDFPTLWIDAVCIDQTNVTERNHQVSVMGKIFRNAWQVYAWLGYGTADSDWYLNYLSRYSAAAMTRYLERSVTSFQQEVRFEEGRGWINSRLNWSRIWIVQEILLAKKVVVLLS